jgi:hypothetical protein
MDSAPIVSDFRSQLFCHLFLQSGVRTIVLSSKLATVDSSFFDVDIGSMSKQGTVCGPVINGYFFYWRYQSGL